MTATAALLAFAAADHLMPPKVRDDAVRLLADTLAVGAAGASAPGADAILAVARGWGAAGEARLLGSAERLPAASAAFVNGYRIHCLEWDAVHEAAVVHAMSVVTAALGAVVDRMGGCNPDDALIALAIGVDIASGLGLAATSPLTFFRPATAGVIGAALAVARVTGAPMADTLGLAYSSCAGTMQAHVEGSIALPFQVANAARAAVAAADMASAGFTGPHDALEGPYGYFTLFEAGDLATYTRDLGHVWRVSEISTKPYPSGRASHGVLGALQGRDSKIERIEAHVPPLVYRLVGRPMMSAMTPAYARLCLPFLVALMLTDGEIDPRRFTPAAFTDPALAALAAKVAIVVDGNPDPNALSPQRLVIDGVEIVVADTLGSPASSLSSVQNLAKMTLAKDLSGQIPDERLFTAPLGYFAGVQ
ncbi:MmgE/PrpD [Sphingomonas antarctica]|uniref:MmgE/PrpD family protein n=1 Tax=Sphingomonas antarctica TaxID=2040274 RepID=UPI0039ECDDDE